MFAFGFVRDAVERALRTYSQVVLGFLGVNMGFSDLDWVQILSVGGVAAVASLLTSVVATKIGDEGTASLV